METVIEQSPLERAEQAVESLIGTHCDQCEAQLPGDPKTIARAVLLAMREPSEGMLEQGVAANYHWGDQDDRNDNLRGWQAMIDAALA